MPITRRRELLAGAAASLILAGCSTSRAATVQGGLPWEPGAGEPPQKVTPGPWHYFTAEEGAAVEALVDRLIPPDPQTPGGRDAGVAVFIDRQLAGAYGSSSALYMQPPFREGTPEQGEQSALTPAARYRWGLDALDAHCRQGYAEQPFARLPDAEKDRLIAALENGGLTLAGGSGRGFFTMLWKDTQEGFFADPVYGGNRGMAAWTMIGFPGARYDYRDWVDKHNQRYPLPPVSIGGRPAWTQSPT